MNDGLIFIMALGLLYVGFCCLMVIVDIAKAVYHQFKGDGYEWYTVKVLKEKREWWKWLLIVSAFAITAYAFWPGRFTEEADFRADRQKDEYTAYYECKYTISGRYGWETGIVSIERKNGHLTAAVLFTEHGFVPLDFFMEEDNVESGRVYGDLDEDGYAEIEIGEGPLNRDDLHLSDDKFYYYGDQCEWCGILLPSEYIFDDGSGSMCPHCLFDDYEWMNAVGVWKCGICGEYFEGSKTELSLCPWCTG